MAEMTYLATVEQAGFDILYALMLSDRHIDNSEVMVIKDFLKTERIRKSHLFDPKKPFYGECNYNTELAYLKSLDHDALLRRFKKAVKSIEGWIHPGDEGEEIKADIVGFAVKLVKADGKIHDAERELLSLLSQEWDMDVELD